MIFPVDRCGLHPLFVMIESYVCRSWSNSFVDGLYFSMLLRVGPSFISSDTNAATFAVADPASPGDRANTFARFLKI